MQHNTRECILPTCWFIFLSLCINRKVVWTWSYSDTLPSLSSVSITACTSIRQCLPHHQGWSFTHYSGRWWWWLWAKVQVSGSQGHSRSAHGQGEEGANRGHLLPCCLCWATLFTTLMLQPGLPEDCLVFGTSHPSCWSGDQDKGELTLLWGLHAPWGKGGWVRKWQRGREESDKMQQLKNKASKETKHTKRDVREMWWVQPPIGQLLKTNSWLKCFCVREPQTKHTRWLFCYGLKIIILFVQNGF